MQIAIDGPAGAGKSTLTKFVAKSLGYIYIDTGAMYRAFALHVINNNVDYEDKQKIVKLLDTFSLDLKSDNGDLTVYLNGENVSKDIRRNEVSLMASNVATMKEVRLKLVSLQRKIASDKDVVMDGRDIGTHVLKDAEIKVFLTASVEDRAKRRYLENIEKGIGNKDLATIKDEIEKRDYNDSHREISPLCKADDAKLFDTTGNTLLESKTLLLSYINERIEQINESKD